MQSKKIGIVSLGLIGGSLFKCLKKKQFENLVVVTRNIETLNEVKSMGCIASADYTVLKDCDVVFVCSPMNKTLEILDKLENIVKPQTIVSDVCSLKQFVMQKKRPYSFVGSHPMAGTENNGFKFSFAELFEEAKWVLTPFEETKQTDLDILKSIIEFTGANVVIADAKQHDETVALISHMPMLLAQALMSSVSDNELAKKLASSGFRDMTRLAMSNVEMADDMIRMNTDNIFNSLLKVIEESRSLLNSSDYADKIDVIKNLRSSMYSSEGKNIV